jgi:glycine cleavage system H lipoate-binding protein/uncharacterized CHY-type Zn-finger protein
MILDRKSSSNETRGMAGLNVIEKQCVWMKAGIINFRICENNYDCFHCSFDKAMRAAMDAQSPASGEKRPAGWAEKMRQKHPGAEKPCVYYLSGRIGPPGNCPRDYQCDDCPVEIELGYRSMQRSIEAARYAGEMEKIQRVSGFQVVENECVWMKAGIVSFRLCDNDYDCYNCEFDRSMRQAMKEKSTEQQQASEMPAEAPEIGVAANPCIYNLLGQKDAPVECSRAYECYRCPVHRALSMAVEIKPAPMKQPNCKTVSGFKIADGYYYHFGHTWIHIVHGECVRVGVDEFVEKIFGAADILDLPQPGALLKQAKVGCVLSKADKRAPVLSPLTGRVIAVNQKAIKDPATVSRDPYHDGWLFQLEPSFLKLETQGLYSERQSFEWMERETERLFKLLGPSYEKLAATGGKIVSDLAGQFPETGWDALVRTFLRTKG